MALSGKWWLSVSSSKRSHPYLRYPQRAGEQRSLPGHTGPCRSFHSSPPGNANWAISQSACPHWGLRIPSLRVIQWDPESLGSLFLCQDRTAEADRGILNPPKNQCQIQSIAALLIAPVGKFFDPTPRHMHRSVCKLSILSKSEIRISKSETNSNFQNPNDRNTKNSY